MKIRRTRAVFALLLAVLLALTQGSPALAKKKKKKTTPTPAPVVTVAPGAEAEPTPVPDGPITDPRSIADYLFAHGELPPNFITKKEATELGWDSRWNYVSDVAPGMSLGGTYFGNYQEQLPVVQGRRYYEADCNYTGGRRGAERIIYSSDGHVWYTGDHYQTFTELFPTGEVKQGTWK